MQVIRPPAQQIPSPLFITGGAHGIGLEVARLASRAGAAVALLDRDGEGAEAATAELASDGGAPPMALACDVSDEAGVADAFAAAAERLGRPEGVVAAAGIDRGGLVHELDAVAWDDVVGVNLRGTFLTCRAALGQMLDGGRGSIVCVSSPFAVATAPGSAAYAASKGGVSALVRALAVDYAEHGIRVNAVLPGPTETALMWANVPPAEIAEARARVTEAVPLGRLAEPSEPARAIAWLLSDEASYVTGSQLPCDGGVLAKASIPV